MQFANLLLESSFHFVSITESWLTDEMVDDQSISGYRLFRNDRQSSSVVVAWLCTQKLKIVKL